MKESVTIFLESAHSFLWSWIMIVILLGTHVFFTFRTGFIQRYVFRGIRFGFASLKDKPENPNFVSRFSSMMLRMGATVGAGNILGVAIAIVVGGPGAVFWCWITGLLGIATKYSETVLSVKYRKTMPDGSKIGGPMMAMQEGMKSKELAIVFCLCTILASYGIGNFVQANTLAEALEYAGGLPDWASGMAMSILVSITILGGVKSVVYACNRLVPFMVCLYILGCLTILAVCHAQIIPALKLIMTDAFSLQSVSGGFLGSALMVSIRHGAARSLFSNEAGMGSSAIESANSQIKDPAEVGMIHMTITFWDTIVICGLTGLMMVCAMLHDPRGFDGLRGVQRCYHAFSILPLGNVFLVVSLATFVLSTLLGWYYYGERCIEYLTKGKQWLILYRASWAILAYIGAVMYVPNAWNFADVTIALMVIPNVISLFALRKVIVNETKTYFKK